MIKQKHVFYFGFFTFVLSWLSGCSTHDISPKREQCIIDGLDAPLWVCKPETVAGYVGLGIVEKNSTDVVQREKIALKMARNEIAKQMQAEVKNKLDKLSLIAKNIDIDNKEEINTLFKSISKEILKSHLNIVKEARIWTSASGKLYLLTSTQKSDFDANIKKAMLSSYKKDTDVWSAYLSTQPLNEFEKEFALTIPQNELIGAQALHIETIANSQVGLNVKNKK